ncbi:MAG TPA: gliding motility-associated C-terminal domain-containing protein [Bacteroidia bacterium]|jgi:gliding motility-associated-like protein|nr:gliding motility-associated C-terminal domain-containing protein [Bacteroidia bacterium]
MNLNLIRRSCLFSLFLILSFITALNAQECGIVYVTPGGATSGVAGTRATPASLSYGLSLVTPGANQVWLATGTYPISTTLIIPGNVTLEGGFNAATWVKSNNSQSIISRDSSNMLTANNALIGLSGSGVANFRLQDITIQVANAPRNGVSVYGIYLSGCSAYHVTRCTINTGSGSLGIPGQPGLPGIPGDTGTRGVAGNPNEIVMPGGAGGAGAGGNNGGAGANTGKWDPSGNSPGTAGLPAACGGPGGATGSGPGCSLGCAFGDPSCGSETPGSVGSPGTSGTPGVPGTTGGAGAIAGGFFVPGTTGGNGATGTDGCGGGGGGGGGGRQKNGADDVGGSGGGGGGGGAAGTGGTGGGGGGSSFAVFLYNNGAAGIIQDCLLNPGAAGVGGSGGAGGNGGGGGAGGAGGLAGPCSNSYGGAGGNGGSGGSGGIGGAGANGMSMALSENGGTPVSNMGIAGVPGNPPVISVTNHGCTNSEVVFSSATAGAWNFGAGATPATANGSGPFSVYYSTQGRKTITQGGLNFTDYINLFQNGPVAAGITPANPTVTLGCPSSFSTTMAGSYYQWVFGTTANPDTVQGGSMQTAGNIYFTQAGTYYIHLYVSTPCCGRVVDSTKVTVNPSASNVTLSASPMVACQGTAITFTASPASYAGYQFYVNGVAVQSGVSNVFSSSGLHAGDSVKVVALAGTCFTNPSAEIKPTINPVPVVTLTSSAAGNTICAGQSVTFTASPAGFSNYQFYNNAASAQNGASNTFTTTALAPGNSITVVGTNGCPSAPSNAIVTTVNPSPAVNAGTDFSACKNGSAITLSPLPSGGSWTGTGVNASGVFTPSAASAGSNMLVYSYTNGSGCSRTDTVIATVNPNPVASISGKDTICNGTATTLTASGASTYSWSNGSTGAVLSVSPSSTASYTVTVTDTHGCTATANVSVQVNPSPILNMTSSNASCGNSNGSATASVSNGLSPWTYSWSNGTTTQTANGLAAGTYTVVVTNASHCTQASTIVVNNNNMPSLTLAAQTNVACNGNATGSASVIVSGGVSPLTYSWNTTPPQTTGNASGLSSGTYTLTVRDSSGCVVKQAVTITQPTALADSATSVHACGLTNGTAIALAGGGTIPYTYSWSPSGGNAASAGGLTSGTYTCNVTDANGCSKTSAVNVVADSIPVVSAGSAITIGYGSSTTLAGSGTGIYNWSPSAGLSCTTCANPSASPTATTTYVLLVTNQAGCSASASVTVTIDFECGEIFVPNAFSPNGDGENDYHCVLGRCIQTLYFAVYDRWGEKVFETTDQKQCWDGIFRGQPLNTASFAYYLKATLVTGETITRKGNISLIR